MRQGCYLFENTCVTIHHYGVVTATGYIFQKMP